LREILRRVRVFPRSLGASEDQENPTLSPEKTTGVVSTPVSGATTTEGSTGVPQVYLAINVFRIPGVGSLKTPLRPSGTRVFAKSHEFFFRHKSERVVAAWMTVLEVCGVMRADRQSPVNTP